MSDKDYSHLACRLIQDENGRVATELYCVETGKPISGVISTSLKESFDNATKLDISIYLSDNEGKKFVCTSVGDK